MSHNYPPKLTGAIRTGRARYGEKFDTSSIDAVHRSVREYYHGPRVILETTYDSGAVHRRAGIISMTAGGWRPTFLVMQSVSQIGSSDLVTGIHTRVVAVQHGNRYFSRTTGKQVKVNAGWHEPEVDQ